MITTVKIIQVLGIALLLDQNPKSTCFCDIGKDVACIVTKMSLNSKEYIAIAAIKGYESGSLEYVEGMANIICMEARLPKEDKSGVWIDTICHGKDQTYNWNPKTKNWICVK